MKKDRFASGMSGVTLIALVITVIIILILAEITIATIVENNGTIERANQAKENAELSQIKEEVMGKWYDLLKDYIREDLSNEEIRSKFEEKLKKLDESATVVYQDDNETFEISYRNHMLEIQVNEQITTNRETAKKEIENAWNEVDKNIDQLHEKLDGIESSDITQNGNKIEINGYKGYHETIENDEVIVGQPISIDKPSIVITKQPENIEVNIGDNTTVSLEATINGNETYQWYSNNKDITLGGTKIPGATSRILTITNVQLSDNKYYYCEIISTLNGRTIKTKTNTALLTIILPNYCVDNTTYAMTLEEAVSIANNGSTIKLLRDYTDTVAATINKNVTLDLQTYTLTRNLTLTVNNGANVLITGGVESKLTTMTQNVYTITNRGILTIDGNLTIENENTSQATITNSTSTATLNIKSGIIKSNNYGVYTYSGTTNIGDATQPVNTSSPIIIGKTYGIYASANVNFNNGIIKGKVDAFGINTVIITPRTGYGIVRSTEIIEDEEYETAFLFDKVYSIEESGNTTYYSKFESAIEDALNGQTINLLKNVLELMDTPINKSISLNLNEYQMKMIKSINLSEGYNLSILGNGTLINKKTTPIINHGSLSINNATIISEEQNATQKTIYNDGTLTIENGIIRGKYNAIYNYYSNSKPSSVIINGGLMEATSDGYAIYNSSTSALRTITINGGTVKGVKYGIYNKGAGATINIGNEIDTLSSSNPTIIGEENGINNDGGTWNFYNGIIMGNPSAYNVPPSALRSGYGIATENHVIGDKTYNAAFLQAGKLILSNTGGTVVEGNSITAATVIGENMGTLSVESGNANIATASISGNVLTVTGTGAGITTITVTESNAGKTGVYFITVKDANFSITGSEGTTYYNKLAESIAVAKNGQTIKVEKDVEDNTIATINKNLTLDLQTHILTRASNTINVNTDIILNLKGTGTIKNTDDSNISLITNNGGTVNVIDNLKIENINSSTSSYAIVNGGKGTINISNGTISAYYQTIRNNNCNGTVNISGGNIYTTATTGTRYGIYNYAVNNNYSPKVIITGGTILNEVGTEGSGYGIYNYGANSTAYIGSNADALSTTTPKVFGKTKGIYNFSSKWYFYNGVIGSTDSVYYGEPELVREQCEIKSGTDMIENVTYNTVFLGESTFYVTPRYKYVAIGQTDTVTAAGTGEIAITCVNNNTNIATVNVSGTTINITGVAKGTTKITVTETNTGKTDTCIVEVIEPNYGITVSGNTSYYETLASAMENVQNNQTITVLNSITETEEPTLSSGKTGIKLDMNGNTTLLDEISLINNGELDIYTSLNGGKLEGTRYSDTINNKGILTTNNTSAVNLLTITSVSDSAIPCIIHNNPTAKVTLKTNTKITFETPLSGNDYSPRYLINNDTGLVNIQGATLINKISGEDDRQFDCGISNTYGSARVIMTSGTLDTIGEAIYNYTSSNSSLPGIEISGGESETHISTEQEYTILVKAGKVLINGGTITSSGMYTIRSDGSDNIITISGGKIVSTGEYTTNAIYAYKGVINITGGTILGAGEDTGNSWGSSTAAINISSQSTVNISGGEIISQNSAAINNFGTLNISEGTITGQHVGIDSSGTIVITGGEISSPKGNGIHSTGLLTIGVDDGTVTSSTTAKPSITGTTTATNYYGVYASSTGTFNFYDGVIKGRTGKSIYREPDRMPSGYTIHSVSSGGIDTTTLINN